MIIGHSKILLYLNNLIQNKNVLRNYLFLGSEGVGKSKIVNLFIRAVIGGHNDLQSTEDCRCQVCQVIKNNICSDFILINKEKDEIGIDDIRALKKKLLLKPVSQYRVVLIEQAQNLTDEASNAILKILEDIAPPTFFIFLATRILKPTIVSRLEVIKFHFLTNQELSDFFKYLALNPSKLNFRETQEKFPVYAKTMVGNQSEIKYLAGGRAGRLIDLISSQTQLQSSINFFNEFVAMIKSPMKSQFFYIDNYLKNDGQTSVFLEYWLKVLTDFLVGDLTGQAIIPNSLMEKLISTHHHNVSICHFCVGGHSDSTHNFKDLVKFLKRILVLKELDSRYNLNKKLLLEQLALD